VGTEWEKMLRTYLSKEFFRKEPLMREIAGRFLCIVGFASAPANDKEFNHWLRKIVKILYSDDNLESIDAAITIRKMAVHNRIHTIPGMVEGLLAMLDKNGPSAHAGAWALFWLASNKIWAPTRKETEYIISFVSNTSSDIEAVYLSIDILGIAKSNHAVEAIIARLYDESEDVRKAAYRALAKIQEDETGQKLLSRDIDADDPWLDPQDPIDEDRVKKAAKELKIPEEEVRQRYEKLAEKYKLKVGWQ
jgi:hypothetical protein